MRNGMSGGYGPRNSRAVVREIADLLEHCPAIAGDSNADKFGHLSLQVVHATVGVNPTVGQSRSVEAGDQLAELVKFEQLRSFGNEEPNGQLNRRNVIDQIEAFNRVQQIAIIAKRQPGVKRNKRWHEGETAGTARGNRFDEIGACVALLQHGERSVVNGFDSARDEQAARIAQSGKQMTILEQMFDLDGHVVTQRLELCMHSVDHADRVRGPVEKIGITERDVPRSRRDLRTDVGGDDVGLDNPELSFVNRHNRTVTA
jgi:hypothetical protein